MEPNEIIQALRQNLGSPDFRRACTEEMRKKQRNSPPSAAISPRAMRNMKEARHSSTLGSEMQIFYMRERRPVLPAVPELLTPPPTSRPRDRGDNRAEQIKGMTLPRS
jgi:hypothetical protein